MAPEFPQHESYEAAAVAQGNLSFDFAEKRECGAEKHREHPLVANKGAREMAQDLLTTPTTAQTCWYWQYGRTGLMHLLMAASPKCNASKPPALLIIRSKAEEAIKH